MQGLLTIPQHRIETHASRCNAQFTSIVQPLPCFCRPLRFHKFCHGISDSGPEIANRCLQYHSGINKAVNRNLSQPWDIAKRTILMIHYTDFGDWSTVRSNCRNCKNRFAQMVCCQLHRIQTLSSAYSKQHIRLSYTWIFCNPFCIPMGRFMTIEHSPCY